MLSLQRLLLSYGCLLYNTLKYEWGVQFCLVQAFIYVRKHLDRLCSFKDSSGRHFYILFITSFF